MAKHSEKSRRIDTMLTALIYFCAAVCIILGVILLVRRLAPESEAADLMPETAVMTTTEATTTTAATTTAATTTTAMTTTTAATETEIESDSKTEPALDETAAFEKPSASDLDYEKTFFSDFLFVGDSISTGLSGYNFLPAENVFAKQGFTPNNIPGKKLSNLTVTEKAANMQPQVIVIMLGTNGLSYVDTGVMAKAYGELIDDLAAVSPDSQFVILAIPPVTKEHENTKPENLAIINEYNGKLKILADDKGAVFIDINTALAAEGGYTADIYAEADGLHLKGEAYKRILSEIEEALSETE